MQRGRNVYWPFKKIQKPSRLDRVDTEVLAAKRAARSLLRVHIGATFALGTALIISLISLGGVAVVLSTQQVDYVLRLSGVLQAREQSTPVTHDTGGIVSNVFVTDGEIVSEGQILMSLDASDIEGEREEAQRRVAGLMLQSLCLQAERAGSTEINVPQELKIALGRLNQLAELQRRIRDCRGALQQAALEKMVAKDEIVTLTDQVQLYLRLSRASQSLRGRLRQLGRSLEEDQIQKTLNIQKLVESLKNQIKVSELKRQLTVLVAAQQEGKISDTRKIDQNLDRIIDALALAEQKLARLDRINKNRFIYASNSGRVQRLRIKKGGKRIARGAYLLEIAPLTTDFEVLATVNLAELPYVSVGQKVSVSLSLGLPRAVAVPAVIANIVKATKNTRILNIKILREDLNRRDLLIGERSLNGLGERSEALIEVQSKNALSALGDIIRNNFGATKL